MSTIADEWIREGEQKGLLQGLQQGITQGELAVLRCLLTRRFGTLPLWTEAKLDSRNWKPGLTVFWMPPRLKTCLQRNEG